MDKVEAEGLVAAGNRADLLGNTLVVVGPAGAPPVTFGPDFAAALGQGPLAMAQTASVPAGIYGKAALVSMGLWDAVQDKVVEADNVRGALAFVAAGEAPLGIVYATDAQADPKVAVVAEFPAGSHPPIVYPVALIGEPGPAATEFYDYLRGPDAANRFAGFGFDPVAR
jgi:molybdate transport system substrate-binding protein